MSLATAADRVTVRMYNVGFGDAFLIVFPGPDRPRRVLVDCGSHASGPGPREMAEVVAQIVEDVTDDDGVARIDVVVGTHRHRDHVSGFSNKQWKAVEVAEVWMPWTEHPSDPEARRIREHQSALAAALDAALAAPGANATAAALAMNALTNERAMDTLHRGFAGMAKRRFLPATDQVVTRVANSSLREAGIEVQVLGPSRDETVIRDMDPPEGAGYLRLAGASVAGAPASPFVDGWSVTERQLKGDPRRAHLLLSASERACVEEAAKLDPFGVAVALEKAVNGTSLVLVFRQDDACLLFGGDAQWGTWKRILDAPGATSLLKRTNFVKVGHHGSHNATPKALVELLEQRDPDPDDGAVPLWAMVSTRPIAMWKHIPKPELLTALEGVTPQLARSDKGGASATPGFASWTEDFIDAEVPL